MTTLPIDLSQIPYFLIVFYAALPALVFFVMGSFWARIYMIFSSLLGAMAAYAAPIGFLQLLIPPVIPSFVTNQIMGMAAGILQYGLLIFAAIIFFVLALLQHAILKLLEWSHWRGEHRHDSYGERD
ncbi:MAG: hypothetical protein JRN26_00950 [Nitrososphaerota archaeon]|jgi:hypothetical protein|nr:hypothetical protein [Nitrososphaerota archaeon]MDG6928241.1 hypothetical protein [Nitrososphaerota archaeon]MDG6930735.1 hypothetical protein [Nitrososphaerota archaeon]MDG6931829.1 hypothetical protein [Nitrososphaerota archaeon]MDG6935447.1 hypothetical protein [Nitrososphaerota archaeon]